MTNLTARFIVSYRILPVLPMADSHVVMWSELPPKIIPLLTFFFFAGSPPDREGKGVN